jgi:hypothetical protein
MKLLESLPGGSRELYTTRSRVSSQPRIQFAVEDHKSKSSHTPIISETLVGPAVRCKIQHPRAHRGVTCRESRKAPCLGSAKSKVWNEEKDEV